MSQLSLQLLRSDDAIRWLESDIGITTWKRLFQACSWRFPTLGIEYCRLWYQHYRDSWEPLLLVGKDQHDRQQAIFPLALEAHSITGAGAHQAEYHGWLSDESIAGPFLRAALAELRLCFPRHTVRLRYLAPGIPQELVKRACIDNPRIRLSHHPRPLLRLDSNGLSKVLRKKNTRSKINRLERIGPLSCRQVTDKDAIRECLEAVIPLYDLRQGAINDSCPFTDDPRKKPFLLEWSRHALSGELYFHCLHLGKELIGAHIGVKGQEECQLAILAHAPGYSACSPGKILVYRTAELLAEDGLKYFDLTPGGDPWKERFATDHDTVLSLLMDPGLIRAYRRRMRSALEQFARSLLKRLGISPAHLKSWIRQHNLLAAEQASPGQDRTISPIRPYVLSTRLSIATPPATVVNINTLGDLCLYQSGPGEVPRQLFLQGALSRLEAGMQSCTLLVEGRLACCAWTRFERISDKSGQPRMIISGIYAAEGHAPELKGLISSIVYRQEMTGEGTVILECSRNDTLTMDLVERLGFEPMAESIAEIKPEGKET